MENTSYTALIGVFALLAAGVLLSGCVSNTTVCDADFYACQDGTNVARDPANNCNFKACPQPAACSKDLYTCPDGTKVARNSANNCQFNTCPAAACTEEAKRCYDDSYVGRNASKNCAFDDCPAPVACPMDAKLCPNGTSVGRNSSKNCAFDDCPIPTSCTNELKLCYDGSYMSRNLSKLCAFDACPTAIIPVNQTNSTLASEGETCAGPSGIKCQSGLQCITSGQIGSDGSCTVPAPATNELQQCPITRNEYCTANVDPVCGKLGTDQTGFRDYTNSCEACSTRSNAIGYYMGTCENQ